VCTQIATPGRGPSFELGFVLVIVGHLTVAGFRPDQIDVTVNQNMLIVSGTADQSQDTGQYLYRGIAGRSFERRFNLADYVEVKGANIDDGLLQIALQLELPEAMKPRRIDIKSGNAIGKDDNVRTIEHSKIA
jgi:molecular chaperone IbpA